MTGLLIKDWKLLKNQGRYFLFIFFIAMAILLAGNQGFISYITFCVSYFALSTVSYDEYDNGMAFLMALPVDRRTYVSEKYLLTVLLSGSSWLLSIGLYLISSGPPVFADAFRETLCPMSSVLLTILIFLSVSLPLILKFGQEKGRMVSFGILGIAVLAAFALMKMEIGITELKTLDRLASEYPLMAFGICILSSVFVVLISFLISLKLMERKEF